MSHILIVGQKFTTLTDYILAHGHEYTFIQDVRLSKFPDKKFKRRILGDFSSKEALLTSLEMLTSKPDAVIATYENYVLAAAWIAEFLKLPGLPVFSAEACTDKFLMRSLFDTAPEKISPAFAKVSSEDELTAFAKEHSFPLILKPANLAKSLLVTKNNSLEELIANYRKSHNLLLTTYLKYAPNRQPKLIIEEFLQGSVHSVDAFVDAQGIPTILEQVVDYQTGYDIGYDDNFHYSRVLPSTLSQTEVESLRHCAELGIIALGMKNSPAHVEIIMTENGPRIVEIGARNGGYRERMHAIANGIDITGIALSVAIGNPPIIKATRNDACAVLELFPKTPGIFMGIANILELQKLASLNYISIKAHENSFVGKSADGYKMCAVIILYNPDREEFRRDFEYVAASVKVITQ